MAVRSKRKNAQKGSNGGAISSSHDAKVPSSGVVASNGHTYSSHPVSHNVEALRSANVASAQNATAKPKLSSRALAPDLLRGVLIVIMSFDHIAIVLRTFKNGTGKVSEGDSVVVREWNISIAYIIRTLTHLCGPGFTFLLGMGVVYLARSRSQMGWSGARLARYFALRAVALISITIGMGLQLSNGHVWFFNMVLFALAIDYFLTGLLWIAIQTTEPALARLLAKMSLSNMRTSQTAAASHHFHNAMLLVASVLTIWWNLWLSPQGGQCRSTAAESATKSHLIANPWVRLWIWPVLSRDEHILSAFPPGAWLSFSILGLLYGRVVTAKPRGRRALAIGQALVAVIFAIVFVLTRVLRFGNLSEGCLQTLEHQISPNVNPYLVSPKSFFYVVKYPPDVAFWAFTLAVNFLILAAFDAVPLQAARRLTLLLDLGSSALFYYFIHCEIIFPLGDFLTSRFGHQTAFGDPLKPANKRGFDNLFVYFTVWVLLNMIMWPLCRWYSRFKSRKPADSVWRFF